jgi:hypothetical protein
MYSIGLFNMADVKVMEKYLCKYRNTAPSYPSPRGKRNLEDYGVDCCDKKQQL